MPRVVSHSYWIYSGTDHLIGVWKDVATAAHKDLPHRLQGIACSPTP